MDGVGNQFLARTGFTTDQHGCVPFGDQAGLVENATHDSGASDHVFKAELVANGTA